MRQSRANRSQVCPMPSRPRRRLISSPLPAPLRVTVTITGDRHGRSVGEREHTQFFCVDETEVIVGAQESVAQLSIVLQTFQ